MKCIQCHNDQNLNTHMKVEVDGVEYEIHLCDEHAETTTMGAIRTKVADIIAKLTKSIMLATDLGINIMDVLPAKVAAQIMPPKQIQAPSPVIQVVEEMPEELLEQQSASEPQTPDAKPKAISRTKPSEEAPPITDGQTIPDDIQINTNVEQQMITGRGGQPTPIPRKINGKFGSTDIRIAKVTDADIQKRFKNLNDQQDHEGAFGTPCVACGGIGIHPMTSDTCPKCKGSGMLMG